MTRAPRDEASEMFALLLARGQLLESEAFQERGSCGALAAIDAS